MANGCRICFLNKHNTHISNFRPHAHSCYEIIYILSGSGTAVIGNASYPIAQGAYYVVSPQTPHTERFEDYGEILFVGFECGDKLSCPQNTVFHSSDISVLTYFQKIIDEYKQQRAEYESAAAALLSLLLVTVIREMGGNGEKYKDLEYIKTYLEQYSNQRISFGRLARLCGYSYDYFRHVFKRRFGASPQEYLINIRLEHAKRLLRSTAMSCTEIAYDCGFSSSAQLSSLFKREYGVSPTAYKKAD